MDLDQIRSAWENAGTEEKKEKEISKIVRQKSHPVLKSMKRQLIIETIFLTAFLFLYYNIFDGDRKPLWTNVALVLSIGFFLCYSLIGYYAVINIGKGKNLVQSMQTYLKKLKVYAFISVLARMLFFVSLVLFFVTSIKFTVSKYYILAGIIFLFLVQLIILIKRWINRIQLIKTSVNDFRQ